MKKISVLRAMGVAAITMVAAVAQADVIFSNLPAVLPGNLASIGYQATQTSELGDHVQFAGGARNLKSATVTMSNWALAPTGSSAAGFDHSLTFNIYNYTGNALANSLIASKTITTLIPWRPEADTVNCGAGSTKWYSVQDNHCYNGLAFNVTFDFSGMGVLLPDDIVFGLAYNTSSYGANPLGIGGPYDSLNFALSGYPGDPGSAVPSVGTDVDPNSLFWNTATAGWLTNPANVNKFAADTGWAGSGTPSVAFEAVPEPASLALAGIALVGLFASRRRKSA